MLHGRLAALVLAALLAPLALAQETAPVLVERVTSDPLLADAQQPAVAQFRLFNLNPEDDFYVSVTADVPGDWDFDAVPNSFFLQPRNATLLNLSFAPEETLVEPVAFDVTFSFVHGRTGQVTKVVERVEVSSGAPPQVLGFLPNPLSAPFDNEWGSFLLNIVAWSVVAALTVLALDGLVRLFTARASGHTTSGILSKLRRPTFLFVAFYGLGQSLAALPRLPHVGWVQATLVAVAVGIFGLFVLYKILDAGLFYYQRELAPKTQTKIDDVVVPVFRKMGIVVLYVIGIILTLRTLGFDPTIVFAGAGIAGLVIAFAAQDTLSNFFSGLFLLLDRPFVEGDIIVLETGEVARVESVGLRTTNLYEFDHHHDIVVPNNQLASRRITNYSAPDSHFRVDIFVGVSYSGDPRKVERVLREVAEAEQELVSGGVWTPVIQLRDFAESQMTFMLRVTLRDPRDKNRVPSKLRMAIKEAFAREGIEIPYPQRVVHVKGGALPEEPTAATRARS